MKDQDLSRDLSQDSSQNLGRRDFLKGAVVGSAAAATATVGLPQSAQAQQPAAAAPAAEGYSFLNLDEAAFVEWAVASVSARPPHYATIVATNLSGKPMPSDERSSLEAGPNRCAIANVC